MSLAAVALFAACGGSSSSGAPRVVAGDGYTFEVPGGWDVKRTARTVAATHGDVDRVQVTTFPLRKAYRPELFPTVVEELDRVAETLAGELNGRALDGSTVTVDGRRARTYRIVHSVHDHGGIAEDVTFVLRGRTEYQLLCRRQEGDDRAPCKRLVETFAAG